MKVNPRCSEVASSFKKLKTLVLSEWESQVRDSIKRSTHEDSIILLDHMGEIVDGIISILESGEFDEVEYGKAHGFQRAIMTNFSIGDLLEEYSLLRVVIIEYFYPMGDLKCARMVHRYLDILCKHAVLEFLKVSTISAELIQDSEGSEIQEFKSDPAILTSPEGRLFNVHTVPNPSDGQNRDTKGSDFLSQ